MQTQVTHGYWDTNDLCDRLRVSKSTIHRMMKRQNNPFPKPCFYGAGTTNKWEIADVIAWEEREKALKSERRAA